MEAADREQKAEILRLVMAAQKDPLAALQRLVCNSARGLFESRSRRRASSGSLRWRRSASPPTDGAGPRLGRRAGTEAPVGVDVHTGSRNAGGLPRLTVDMTAHGARPIRASHVGFDGVDGPVEQIEAKGGRTLMPAHDIENSGRIAMVADPPGAESARVGTV